MAITRAARTAAASQVAEVVLNTTTVTVTKTKATKANVAAAKVTKVTKVKTESKTKSTKSTTKPTKTKASRPILDLADFTDAEPIQHSKSLHPDFVKGLEHAINVDASLRPVVANERFPSFSIKGADAEWTCFSALGRSIIGQQVSGAAATAIMNRFQGLFRDPAKHGDIPNGDLPFPEPAQVKDCTIEFLRSAGLSARKAEYMIGLAKAFSDGTLTDELLRSSDDDDVVDMIVALKGFGPWSADMFLMFSLQRMDVFSIGDLGVQRGFMNYVAQRPWIQQELRAVDWTVALDGLHSPGKSAKALNRKPATINKEVRSFAGSIPIHKQMEYVANKFKPYRSAYQMILWKLSDLNFGALATKDSAE